MIASRENLLVSGTLVMKIEVVAVMGSAPREAGTWMLASDDTVAGTIGGGQLEYMAIDHARGMLRADADSERLDIPLGPEIGQCCGGRVEVVLDRVDAAMAAELQARLASERAKEPEVIIFGAGHVGRALSAALALLPVRPILIDSREAELFAAAPGAELRLTPLPEAEVAAARPGSGFVVLTHDHALDFLITDAALARGDAAYVGLIGSQTKRARFRRWRVEHGSGGEPLGLLTCPIGGPSGDKRPAVIAAMVAAEIMAALAPAAPVPDARVRSPRSRAGNAPR